jgi:hypothetical protein
VHPSLLRADVPGAVGLAARAVVRQCGRGMGTARVPPAAPVAGECRSDWASWLGLQMHGWRQSAAMSS